jgi:putative transposase
VDTQGLIVQVLVHQAGLQDHEGGKLLLWPLRGRLPRMQLIWADSAYTKGGFVEWVKQTLGWNVEIVEHRLLRAARGMGTQRRSDRLEKIRPSGFHVLPRRWVVERTFAWLSTWRRLSKDYEVLASSEEAWICVAMISILLRRLARPAEAVSAGKRQAHAA